MSFKKALFELVLKISPKSGRRFVVLGSLLPKMTKEIDEKTLKNLNETLGIANNASAMSIPMAMSDEIWDDETSELISRLSKLRDDSKEKESLAQVIYRNLPKYLVYDYTQLEKDVVAMSSIVSDKTGATAIK